MNSKQFHIVYITDRNYAMPTGVSLSSLIDKFSKKENLVVHIVTADIENEDRQYWERIALNKVRLNIIDKTEFVEGIRSRVYQYGYVPPVSLLKFYLPIILDKIDECLYLDSDIIVNDDIASMFTFDLDRVYVAAVSDMGDIHDEGGYSEFAKRIGLKEKIYFNTGVMLLNLKRMRENNVSDKLLNYRIKGKNFFMDQDAINFVLGGQKKILSPRYNFLTTVFDYMEFDVLNAILFANKFSSPEECCRMQKILHMTGQFKAWKYYIPYVSDIFLKHYQRSPYKNNKLELKSPILFFYNKLKELERKKDWKFPYEKIPRRSKLIIYGAGNVGTAFVKQLKINGYCDIVLWCDKYYSTKCKNVVSPQEIEKKRYDYILIAIYKEDECKEIRAELIDIGVPKDKIVIWI